jgi:hypothetical protein
MAVWKVENNNFIINVVMYHTSTRRIIITFIYAYLYMAVEVRKFIRIFSLDKFAMLYRDKFCYL